MCFKDFKWDRGLLRRVSGGSGIGREVVGRGLVFRLVVLEIAKGEISF